MSRRTTKLLPELNSKLKLIAAPNTNHMRDLKGVQCGPPNILSYPFRPDTNSVVQAPLGAAARSCWDSGTQQCSSAAHPGCTAACS
jgi:hypothetical protein